MLFMAVRFFTVIRMAENVIFDVNLRPTEKYMPL